MLFTSGLVTVHEGFTPEPSTGLRFKLVYGGTNYVECTIQKIERGIGGGTIVVYQETVRRYYDSF